VKTLLAPLSDVSCRFEQVHREQRDQRQQRENDGSRERAGVVELALRSDWHAVAIEASTS
jgi:hypothetical protein